MIISCETLWARKAPLIAPAEAPTMRSGRSLVSRISEVVPAFRTQV